MAISPTLRTMKSGTIAPGNACSTYRAQGNSFTKRVALCSTKWRNWKSSSTRKPTCVLRSMRCSLTHVQHVIPSPLDPEGGEVSPDTFPEALPDDREQRT